MLLGWINILQRYKAKLKLHVRSFNLFSADRNRFTNPDFFVGNNGAGDSDDGARYWAGAAPIPVRDY